MKKYALLFLISTLAIAQPKGKKLVWEEQFSGKELSSNWNIELGDGCPNCGWGNNERQLYSDQNHKLVEGNLVITATKEGNKYSSTRITTQGKKEFQYGYFEARAKLPVGQGVWPAFWMLGSNIKQVGWPKCGEIDILEYVGKEPNIVFTSLHTQDSHGNTINTKKTKIETIEQGFHLYAIDWSKDKIAFFVDNKLVYTFEPKTKTEATWPYNQPFYFLINLAIGGDFGGPEVDDSIFPQKFEIDYIKVYQ
ncbi:laminarinase [Flavobacterium faecale]|uniref:Laminarinase n=1 Tax=Flavobacterium faecale TaxID=1355330 RepID=A0A2S1LHY0_9FLAO|nr:glycoside hydrolase family 16 protein [Flavobacterium faecale]AWG23395.1 laminarinase [Flavobacterium faecale]